MEQGAKHCTYSLYQHSESQRHLDLFCTISRHESYCGSDVYCTQDDRRRGSFARSCTTKSGSSVSKYSFTRLLTLFVSEFKRTRTRSSAPCDTIVMMIEHFLSVPNWAGAIITPCHTSFIFPNFITFLIIRLHQAQSNVKTNVPPTILSNKASEISFGHQCRRRRSKTQPHVNPH